jgi:hypothetical protein
MQILELNREIEEKDDAIGYANIQSAQDALSSAGSKVVISGSCRNWRFR